MDLMTTKMADMGEKNDSLRDDIIKVKNQFGKLSKEHE